MGTVLTFQKKRIIMFVETEFPLKRMYGRAAKYIFAREPKSESAAALKCLF